MQLDEKSRGASYIAEGRIENGEQNERNKIKLTGAGCRADHCKSWHAPDQANRRGLPGEELQQLTTPSIRLTAANYLVADVELRKPPRPS
jgi:hypothetical protein